MRLNISIKQNPLRTSAHNIIHLVPIYKSVLKTGLIQEKSYHSGMMTELLDYVAALTALSGTDCMTRAAVFLISLTLLLLT